jgi:hypothetical protein
VSSRRLRGAVFGVRATFRGVVLAVSLALVVSGVSLAAKGRLGAVSTNRDAAYSLTPSNVFPPTISGAARQAQALTESHGTWTNAPTSYSYEWEACDSSGQSCVPIAGATAATYAPTGSDVGHTVVVQETASNAAGSSSPASSAPTAVVLPSAPLEVLPPMIAGAAIEGQTLTESHGVWNNNPTSYSYRWYDCDGSGGACTSISGATGQTYTLVAADIGHTIRVGEAAANAGGTSAVLSAATAIIPQRQAVIAPRQGLSRAHVAALLSPALHVRGAQGTISQILRHGGYTLSLHAPGAGALEIVWFLQPTKGRRVFVARATATSSAAHKVKVRIALTSAGRHLLQRAKHVKLSAIVVFTSSGGTLSTVTRPLTLKG